MTVSWTAYQAEHGQSRPRSQGTKKSPQIEGTFAVGMIDLWGRLLQGERLFHQVPGRPLCPGDRHSDAFRLDVELLRQLGVRLLQDVPPAQKELAALVKLIPDPGKLPKIFVLQDQ